MADEEGGFDIKVEGGLPVTLPSGAQMRVLTSAEQDYLANRVQRYMTDNHFVNIADLQDVDKMITYELFLHRWSLWQAMGEDYFGEPVNVKELAVQIEGLSRELRQVKKQLGIDKVARDRQRGDDSVPAFLEQLQFRAGQFAVMRNEQFAAVLTAFQRLSGIITYHDKCLAAETLVVTAEGTRPIGELAGATHVLLTGGRSWQACEVRCFGDQELYKVDLVRGRRKKIVYATADHRWYAKTRRGEAKNEYTTLELVEGMRIPSVSAHRHTNKISPWGIAHGIVFGDGTRDATQPGSPSRIVLCGDKDAQLLKWFPHSPTRVVVGTGIEVQGLPRSWKDAPSLSEDYAYLTGWLAGYFAADGTIDAKGSASISSTSLPNLEAARDVCYRLGVPTSGITTTVRVVTPPGQMERESTLYRLMFPVGAFDEDFYLIDSHRIHAHPRVSGREILGDFRVDRVQPSGRFEPVYCAVVPGSQSFVLADNLLTGNCTEDERVEFQCTPADVMAVMRSEIAKFEAIDEEFRQSTQQMWIRQM